MENDYSKLNLQRIMTLNPLIIKITRDSIQVYSDLNEDLPLLSREILPPSIQPIVKWAGGKRWLAVSANLLLPNVWSGKYYEPFMGGGAFFFALKPHTSVLADRNSELITTYKAILNDPEGVIKLLSSYSYDEQFYYQLRSQTPESENAIAARLMYLNRTCWNGLYRVNREGKFNTPFGKFVNPTICDAGRIQQASVLLKHSQLTSDDFEAVVASTKAADFVYFDPPYITGHQNNGFVKYNRRLFSWEDQERLAHNAINLSKRGVKVLVSNADHLSVVNLYRGFFYYRTTRRNLIGGQMLSRGTTTEALLSNYPLLGVESEII